MVLTYQILRGRIFSEGGRHCSEWLVPDEREGLILRFGGFLRSVSGVIGKPARSWFHPFEYTFDGVALAVGFVEKVAAIAVERGVQPQSSVNQKKRVPQLVLLQTPLKKPLGVRHDAAKDAHVEEFVGSGAPAFTRATVSYSASERYRSEDGVEPVPLVVEPDHALVDREVILEDLPPSATNSAFRNQLCTVERARSTPNLSRTETVSESGCLAAWGWIPSFISGFGVASRSTLPTSMRSL